MSNHHFPDIQNKLSAPVKLSAFERRKQEAEAKRRREAAEDAAAIKQAVEDMQAGDEGDPLPTTEAKISNMGGFGNAPHPSRHFAGSSMGFRLPEQQPLPPTQSLRPLAQKRQREKSPELAEDDILSFIESNKKAKPGNAEPRSRNGLRAASWGSSDDSKAHPRSDGRKAAFRDSNDSDVDSVDSEPDPNEPKPLVDVWNIPIDMSLDMIEAMIDKMMPAGREAKEVIPMPPKGPIANSGGRKSKIATVRLARGLLAAELDQVAAAFNGKYAGWGYYLRAARQTTFMSESIDHNAQSLYPFGAVPVANRGKGSGGNQVGNYGDNRGGSYNDNRGSSYGNNRGGGYGENRGRGYGDNRSGYGDNRGGYNDNRGGYNDNRGGYSDNRGGGYGGNQGGGYGGNQGGGYGGNQGGNYGNNRAGGYGRSPVGPQGMRGAPNQDKGGGYGQPNYQNARRGSQDFSQLEVKVTPPADLQQMRLIHKTVEGVLTHGVAFEALLMSLSDVQKQEKWAWIWDARSVGGIWYRYRLWELSRPRRSRRPSNSNARRGSNGGLIQLVFDEGPTWVAPTDVPKFEFIAEISEFKDDPDYHESDLDSDDDEGGGRRSFNDGTGPPPEDHLQPKLAFLEPLAKAQLTWLLARLPSEMTKLRAGDVARVTDFAIKHSARGREEIVDMIILNVEKPFCFTSANTNPKPTIESAQRSIEPPTDTTDNPSSELGPAKQQQPVDASSPANLSTEPVDISSAKLVALAVIYDLCVAGTDHSLGFTISSWRYPVDFASELTRRRVFAHLGRLDRDLGWGKMRARRWKIQIHNVLDLWKERGFFTPTTMQELADQFANPPLTAREKEIEAREAAERARVQAKRGKVEIRAIMPADGEGSEGDEGGLASVDREQERKEKVQFSMAMGPPQGRKRKPQVL
ncbi:uncharacterized protein BDZ99DRAFT_467975 [Mytilinidion resinicola]|uniref:CID domain-containing protein n=1 Tax=Mytilinidion resinicola TaxID=574789 RepID=A0A6A6Y4T8_9PEZI|nr:uncharacterized protein BDZ99DRAFT_467975 [Mytilinidion resinicola]KAF2803861.1 hypothetical protein BDZ99DRAFT_467975 [Mytilinidion resinicola]